MPTEPTPGRSLVTRRAVVDIIRTATLGSYGVTGLSGSLSERVLAAFGIRHPGVHVVLSDPLEIDLELTVAYGLPIAEVARQVDSAVRYAIRRALALEVGRLTIHVDGLRYQPGRPPRAPDLVEPTEHATGSASSALSADVPEPAPAERGLEA